MHYYSEGSLSEALIKQVSCIHADSPCGIVSACGVPNAPPSQILLLSALQRQIAICHHVPNWLTCNPSDNIVSISENHYLLRHCPRSSFTTMVPFDVQILSVHLQTNTTANNNTPTHLHAQWFPVLEFYSFQFDITTHPNWQMTNALEGFIYICYLTLLRLIASVISWNKR